MKNIDEFIVQKQTTLPDAMAKIDTNSNGVVFVVDEDNRLCGALSDGDIRRWLLKGKNLQAVVAEVMLTTPKSIIADQVADAPEMMRKYCITTIPVVDEKGHIIDICSRKEEEQKKYIQKDGLKEVPVIIMAGGKGTRLYPYTRILPKPLIPIGDVPILERVMDYFYQYGADHFYLSVNYKKHMIQSYFEELMKGYHVTYVEENEPLGTGGSVRLIQEKFEKPIIIANCDSIIRAEYDELYQYHLDSENDITMVVAMKRDTIPYGVVYAGEDGVLDHMDEKPTRSYLINTGMYIINPELIEFIPEGRIFHMTQLVEEAKKLGYKVRIYPVSEDSFLDMGEFAEMRRMEEKLGVYKE